MGQAEVDFFRCGQVRLGDIIGQISTILHSQKMWLSYGLADLFADRFDLLEDIQPSTTIQTLTVSRRLPTSTTAGYVYVIRSQYGFKIGKTVNIRTRTRLFEVKLPFPISIEHYAWFEDYTSAERNFHQMFRDKRLEGEWFNLSPQDINVIKGFGKAV